MEAQPNNTCSIAVSHHNNLDSYTEGAPSYQ